MKRVFLITPLWEKIANPDSLVRQESVLRKVFWQWRTHEDARDERKA